MRTAWPLAALLSVCALALAQGQQPVPRLEARVTDLTGTLTAEQQSSLEEKLAAFESRKGAQVAVLIVPTTQPEEIEQYSIRVVDEWKLGREKPEDGVLLLVAKNDRRLRIEVGRGLEGVLPDAIANRITDDIIAPQFRQGNFFGGINAGVEQILRVIDGEPLPEPDRRWSGGGSGDVWAFLPVLFVAVLIGSLVLRAIFGRVVGSAITGGGVTLLVFLLGGALLVALILGILGFVFSLSSGVARGARWSSSPRHRGWGGGLGGGFGGGGFGGGFGGGGGGFSGGGGGFSGGGASGSW